MDPNPEPETLTAWPCAVDVCERPQQIGEGCVCDTCADMSWHHGHHAFGERLCDGCSVPLTDDVQYGVAGGEGSADWLCSVCMADALKDVQIERRAEEAHAAHATMSRAGTVVGDILDACMSDKLPETVWAAAEEARDALSRLRHALWEVKTGEVAASCCDRHAMNPDHAGPCAAWLNSTDTDDGCEVVE